MTLLGWVNTEKPSSVKSTPTKKKKHSDGSPKSSKRRHSSKPTSDDLKSLDEKWSERFSRLEALLLNKSFAMPVEPVKPATVVTREHPFFDTGAYSSVGSVVLVTEGTGPSLSPSLSPTGPSLPVLVYRSWSSTDHWRGCPVVCYPTSAGGSQYKCCAGCL